MSESIGASFSASFSLSGFQPSFGQGFSPESFDSSGFGQSGFGNGASSGFSQQAPLSNQANALGFLQAASEASDPGMQTQLLQDALQQLNGGQSQGAGGGSGAQGGIGGMQQEIQQLQQEVQQLEQQIQQLQGGSGGPASPLSSGGGAASPASADGGSGAGAGGQDGISSQGLQDGLNQLQGGSMQQAIQQLQQEIQQLEQQIQQLEGNSSGGSSAPSPSAGGTGAGGGASAGAADPTSGTGVAGGATGAGQNGSSNLSVNGNSVNTGMYTISGSANDDGSLTITNNQTGQSTEVWGDPHVKVNGQDTADFQNSNLNIQLQDGTTVHIQPTAVQNGVAHIDQVSITNANGQSVTMGGNNGTFQNGVTTSGVQQNGAGVQDNLMNAPNTTNTTLGADGMLHYDNANGSEGAVIGQTNGGETDLDGAGGGLANQNGTGTSGGANEQQLLSQLMRAVHQHSSGMNQQLMSMIIHNMESSMQSNSKANIAA